MSNWQTVKLGDCTEIARGSSPRPINDNAYFYKGTIPWVKIADATASFKYIYETKEYVNEYGASFSRKLPPGSLIVAASGTLGFAIFLGVEGCVHDGWMYFKRIDEGKLNKQFLYYLLNTLTKSFNAFSYGAAIQNINTDILRNTEFRIPTLNVQKNIAAIFSAYDELIENNQQRIALLEKMAEEIYREWFVRLRFPGHEKVKKVKGVPEGWEIDRVDSIGKIVTGKTPSTDNPRYFGGPYFFIKTPDMHGNIFIVETEEMLSQNGLDSQPSQTIPRGSICVSCIGTGGIVSITTSECQTNQQINSVVVRNPSDLEWAFFTLRNLREAIQMFGATGATMTNLSKGKFSSLKILRPNKSIVLKYHALVNPIFVQMQSILQQTMILRSTRDLLLPRLISGKLSVEHLDIQFPPGMEESACV